MNRELVARKAVIKSTCRELRGDDGALEEALSRIRDAYFDLIRNWTPEKMKDHNCVFNVCITVEYER